MTFGKEETSRVKFKVHEASWKADSEQLSEIRRVVFIEEQNVSQEEEWDGLDEDSHHWIALQDGKAIGTARLLPDGIFFPLCVSSLTFPALWFPIPRTTTVRVQGLGFCCHRFLTLSIISPPK